MLSWLPEGSAPRRAALTSKVACVTDAPLAFTARQFARRRGIFAYRIRDSRVEILVRHNTIDAWTLAEIFHFEVYRPPPEIARRIASHPAPKIVDLGANIGLFGAYIFAMYPEARVVGFEPDPENAAIHAAVISRNRLSSRWRLIQACAGAEDGVAQFIASGDTFSRIDGLASESSIPVQTIDVLPELASASLVKIDIEGGEWPILSDQRIARAQTLVMEYHRHLCPGERPFECARDLLTQHGFTIGEVERSTERVGMLWAWRD